MAKHYKAKGFLQNINTMKMMPVEFDVLVSKDSHTTVTIGHEQLDYSYCVEFSQIAKDIIMKSKL